MGICSSLDVSLKYQGAVKTMPTLKELRKQAGMTAFELAVAANVSIATINRLERIKSPNSRPVSQLMAYKVINVIAQKLSQKIPLDGIEGLNTVNEGKANAE